MCGIAGIYAYHYAANPVDAVELCRIRDHMAARGPDGAGAWYSDDGRVGLANRRLAIIDLSDRGAQPMISADGRLALTFNGEIYNYKELRRTLESRGAVFRSDADTEVLLHLYAWKGREMVHDLRGMFALALWDDDRRGLLLARDPYGIKPLYVADDGWTLRFASQVKALIAGGRVARDVEPAGWVGFFLLGSVPEPFTTYQEVRAVPAGATVWIDRHGMAAPSRYFSVSEVFRSATPRSADAQDRQQHVRSAVLDSVRRHLVADVPVGLFLSSGVDSGALLGLMRDAGQHDIRTITIAYEEFSGRAEDEAPIAEQVSALYGARHTTRIVSEAEFHSDLPQILAAMDQPSIDGINTWFVSKAAHAAGLKAAISGLGGDELFGGYASFTRIPRMVRLGALPAHVPLLGDAVQQALRAMRRLGWPMHPKLPGTVKHAGDYPQAYLLQRGVFMASELSAIIDGSFMAEGLRRLDPVRRLGASLSGGALGAFGKVAALEADFYLRNQLLRDTDWASMAHSLEVRVPLVDAHLLRELAPVLATPQRASGKQLLAASPSRPLPGEVLARGKTGFTTPIAEWMQADRRIAAWRQVPQLRAPDCPWARRWAVQLAAASGFRYPGSPNWAAGSAAG